MGGIQRWGWRCWSSSMSTHGGSQLFLALLRLHLDDFIFRWLLESNVEGDDVDQRGLQPMAAAPLCSYHPDDFIFTWLQGFNVEDGDDDQHRHQPMVTRPAEPLFVTIWSISHEHAPQDCYKIVPCNSNVLDFVIFKLQHLSVFNINRTYTLDFDVKIFLLMYKCLFSFYSQEISRQKKNNVIHIMSI